MPIKREECNRLKLEFQQVGNQNAHDLVTVRVRGLKIECFLLDKGCLRLFYPFGGDAVVNRQRHLCENREQEVSHSKEYGNTNECCKQGHGYPPLVLH